MKGAGQCEKSRYKGPEADLRARERESGVGLGSGNAEKLCWESQRTGGWERMSGRILLTSERTLSDCRVNYRPCGGKQPRQAAPVETQVRDTGLGPAWQQWGREVVAERGFM